jgi:hypothetical protein
MLGPNYETLAKHKLHYLTIARNMRINKCSIYMKLKLHLVLLIKLSLKIENYKRFPLVPNILTFSCTDLVSDCPVGQSSCCFVPLVVNISGFIYLFKYLLFWWHVIILMPLHAIRSAAIPSYSTGRNLTERDQKSTLPKGRNLRDVWGNAITAPMPPSCTYVTDYPQSSSTLWNYRKCGVYTVESEAGC